MVEVNKIYNCDFAELIDEIETDSVDVVLIDPPYLYLKHKLDIQFDENKLFNGIVRILKKEGFLVLFGRGVSFYKWNTMLHDLNMAFKEEIVWNKESGSSPVSRLNRVHETITIWTKEGSIRKSHIPYVEGRIRDFDKALDDVNRLNSAINKQQALDEVMMFLQNGIKEYKANTLNHAITSTCKKGAERHISVANTMKIGFVEKSIITVNRDHYRSKTIHPTQKPIRLLERLLNVVSDKDCLVIDFFSGSASTAIACINTDRKFIGFEIDKEYFDAGNKRIQEHIQ